MRPRHAIAVALALITLIAQVAGAQQAPLGVRMAGSVKSVAGDTLILTTAKGDVVIKMTSQTRVLLSQPASASDIKPGAYLGTANQDAAAPNSGTATEVHLANNGPNVNYPMNQSGLTMTNGHVTNVTHTASGEEMDINYGQSTTRHVVVPADAQVTRMADVGAAGLKRHVRVTALTTTGTDGKPVATFILIAPPPAAK
jgi:hypothetical protein